MCNWRKTQWNTSLLKKPIFTSHLQNHDICIIDFSAPNQLLWKHCVMKFCSRSGFIKDVHFLQATRQMTSNSQHRREGNRIFFESLFFKNYISMLFLLLQFINFQARSRFWCSCQSSLRYCEYVFTHEKWRKIKNRICNNILPFSFCSSAVVTCTSQAPVFFNFIWKMLRIVMPWQ